MKGIIAIIKKEFARFFLDRRMLLTTIIMPGLLIYIVYTLMGTFMTELAGGDSRYSAAVKILRLRATTPRLTKLR